MPTTSKRRKDRLTPTQARAARRERRRRCPTSLLIDDSFQLVAHFRELGGHACQYTGEAAFTRSLSEDSFLETKTATQ